MELIPAGGAKAKCALVAPGHVAPAPLPFTAFDLMAAIVAAQSGLGRA